MRNNIYAIPAGVKNYLPEECYNKHLAEEKILKEFALWGYDEIEIAPLEYYENYRGGRFRLEENRMMKFQDEDGKMVALPPDFTLPILRQAIKADSFPVKYAYRGNVFDCLKAADGASKSQSQAGIEYMGNAGISADIEVIALAVNALKAAGMTDFKIDLGQVNFYNGLMAELGIDGENAELLRDTVEKKNMLGVGMQLKKMGAGDNAYGVLGEMLNLFGGVEVIARAKKLASNPVSLSAVRDIERVYQALSEYGLEAYISIDFSVVQRVNYYSGIVFQGLSRYLGAPVMTGGRYDKLSLEFDRNIPATGFAVDVKKLLIALERQNALQPCERIEAAVGTADVSQRQAYALAQTFRTQGKRTLLVCETSIEEFRSYLSNAGIPQGIYIDGNGKEISVGKGGDRHA